MSYKFATYEKRDHIATITINRPDVMNALHPEAHQELNGIWDDYQSDPDSWVAILTGTGDRAFSAGADLKFRSQHPGQEFPLPPGGFGGITSRFDLWKPTLAAVNGFALGGGFEMALACDIIVAVDTATFGLPEPKRGLFAGAGGTYRLPRSIPLKIAMGMMLTGAHISANEAHGHGLVNEVVSRDRLMPTAKRWADAIAECSPAALRATKQGALDGLRMSLPDAMRYKFEEEEAARLSPDRQEGPLAFVEKRKPSWS